MRIHWECRLGARPNRFAKGLRSIFLGTVKKLSAAGFHTIELCSPTGYAEDGFASIAKYKGAELPRLLADLNVECAVGQGSLQI